MDRLIIERDASTEQGTSGTAELYHPAGIAKWTGHSLELPDRGNQHDISCIPVGVYTAKYEFSSKFQRKVYKLQDVPGRANCELHIGNYAGDTSLGYRSDVEGCTVFGTDLGKLVPMGFRGAQLAVLHSGTAFDGLVEATGGADIEVEYSWKGPQ
jgi:hypothetical protein